MKDEQKMLFVHPSSFILHPCLGGMLSVALSLSFAACKSKRPGRWALPTTASFGARTFLSPAIANHGPTIAPGSGRPAGPRTLLIIPQHRRFLSGRALTGLVELALRSEFSPILALLCVPNGS